MNEGVAKGDIKQALTNALENYSSTFKETSYDKANNTYLCQDEITQPVFDFDAYVNHHFPQKTLPYTDEKPASPDAVYLGRDSIYFVEFKNQEAGKIKSKNIRSKFEKGTRMLRDITSQEIKNSVTFVFCVVYKDSPELDSSPFNKIAKGVRGNTIKFGLSKLNEQLDNFYDKIITRPLDFYKQNFKYLQCK